MKVFVSPIKYPKKKKNCYNRMLSCGRKRNTKETKKTWIIPSNINSHFPYQIHGFAFTTSNPGLIEWRKHPQGVGCGENTTFCKY